MHIQIDFNLKDEKMKVKSYPLSTIPSYKEIGNFSFISIKIKKKFIKKVEGKRVLRIVFLVDDDMLEIFGFLSIVKYIKRIVMLIDGDKKGFLKSPSRSKLIRRNRS